MPIPGAEPPSSSSTRDPSCGSRQASLGGVLGALASGQDVSGDPPRTHALNVLPSAPARVAKSKNATRRAIVLSVIHALIIAHIVHWWLTGTPTLSPVEPSETMYTLEKGHVNAGFVMFAVAILSTFLFGRFFCGWACHVVALQDLCGWIMKKLGVRPKPLRSRLLLWAPLILALYMFVWPTLKREVIKPVAEHYGTWTSLRAWLGESPPPVFRSWTTVQDFFQPRFMVSDFWATFPPWYVAIPFLLVCGFACVYFLGAKGFCTYGCPYGGFFAPADTYAAGRIVVNDNCEHCGHCTSVCTSNVRVHEEVRDYGMVVDPGCMKCLDCVSVCPNDALSLGFVAPTARRSRLKKAAKAARQAPSGDRGPLPFKQRVYDWSRREEIVYGVLFFLLLVGYRGMYDMVPLLMAMGLAGIGTFLTWKLVQLVREPSVRIQNVQLKLKGAIKPAGVLFGVLSAGMLLVGLWGATVKTAGWYAGVLAGRITLTSEQVFRPGATVDPEQRDIAARAYRLMRFSGSPALGGIGYDRSERFHADLGWLAAVKGDMEAAESIYIKGLNQGAGSALDAGQPMLNAVGLVLWARGKTIEDVARVYGDVVAAHPKTASTRVTLAQIELQRQRPQEAKRLVEEAVTLKPASPEVLLGVAGVFANLGDLPRTRSTLEAIIARYPKAAQAHRAMAFVLMEVGEPERALASLDRAIEADPRDPSHVAAKGQILRALGRTAEADAADRRAAELHAELERMRAGRAGGTPVPGAEEGITPVPSHR